MKWFSIISGDSGGTLSSLHEDDPFKVEVRKFKLAAN